MLKEVFGDNIPSRVRIFEFLKRFFGDPEEVEATAKTYEKSTKLCGKIDI